MGGLSSSNLLPVRKSLALCSRSPFLVYIYIHQSDCEGLCWLFKVSFGPFLQPAQDILFSSPASTLVNCCPSFAIIPRLGKCTWLPPASSYRSLIEIRNRPTPRRPSRGAPFFHSFCITPHQTLTSLNRPLWERPIPKPFKVHVNNFWDLILTRRLFYFYLTSWEWNIRQNLLAVVVHSQKIIEEALSTEYCFSNISTIHWFLTS